MAFHQDESASDQMKLLGRGGNWWSVKWGHPVCDQLREALGVEVRDVARARVISVDSVTAGLSEDGTEAVKSRGRAAFARWEQTKFYRIDEDGDDIDSVSAGCPTEREAPADVLCLYGGAEQSSESLCLDMARGETMLAEDAR